jgi:D-tyrosyl-tRNA(Tyr) deacylase
MWELYVIYGQQNNHEWNTLSISRGFPVFSPLQNANAMIGLLQRVSRAEVHVAGERIAAIGVGLLVLIGVQRGDTAREAARLAERLLSYRVFNDENGRMNLALDAVAGSILLVPQFTLAADTAAGTRAGFSRAADPVSGERLFQILVGACRSAGASVATGRFGADMQVSLTNDGPVTFWLEVRSSER